MSVESYERDLSAWKSKHGITTPGMDAPDPEELMVAEDAKRKGKDYCAQCTEQFKICDMRLVTRSDDPYIQYDEDEPSNKPDWYIQVQHRIRMCKPCFKEMHQVDGVTDGAGEAK